MVKMRGGVNGDEEFDEAGRDDDVEEASFRGSQCKPVIEKKIVSTSCSRSFSWNLDNSPLVLGRSCNKISSTNEYFNVLHVRSRQHTD